MTFPIGGGCGVAGEAGRGEAFRFAAEGVGAPVETEEDGRDHPGPVVVDDVAVAVSLAVTKRE